MTTATLLEGNCLDQLRTMADESVHAIVTDPPYGLANTDPVHVVEALTKWATGNRDFIPAGKGFMGKAWDAFVPPPSVWDECMRVLKPGGHLLAFAGSRTFDLMTLSVRFAGFDIRDSIAWLYGSGFPKGGSRLEANGQPGWGTALKPAFEPIVVARKPFPGTVAGNVLAHGTGAFNIDATRIETTDNLNGGTYSEGGNKKSLDGDERDARGQGMYAEGAGRVPGGFMQPSGRWPANLILDESQAAELDLQTGTLTSGKMRAGTPRSTRQGAALGEMPAVTGRATIGDSGGASRFFYVAKAPKSERPVVDGVAHPTVKPLALIRHLVKLVTPPGGIVVDPFAGSGTTMEAAHLEGFDSIGIEMTDTYWPLIRHRIERAETAASAATSNDDEALFTFDQIS